MGLSRDNQMCGRVREKMNWGILENSMAREFDGERILGIH